MSPSQLIINYLTQQNGGSVSLQQKWQFLQQHGLIGGKMPSPPKNPTDKQLKKYQSTLIETVSNAFGSLDSSKHAGTNLLTSLGIDPAQALFQAPVDQTTPTNSSSPTGTTKGVITAPQFNQASYDQAMKDILSDPLLTADQKSHLQTLGFAMATGDKAKFTQMLTAFEEASKFSDPYFKAQVNMSLDALKQSFLSRDSDLQFKQDQLHTALQKAQADYASSSEYNTLSHNQELQQYISALKNDLQANADSMAAAGFTSSSKNLDAQKIINDQNAGLVESSNMKYNYQKSTADAANTATLAGNVQQLQYYKDLAAQGKLADLRKTEAEVGSAALTDYSKLAQLVPDSSNILGGVGGSIPEAQVQDAASAANTTVGSNQPYSFAF